MGASVKASRKLVVATLPGRCPLACALGLTSGTLVTVEQHAGVRSAVRSEIACHPPNALAFSRGRAKPACRLQRVVGGLRKFSSSVQGTERNGGEEGVPRSPVARRRALFPHACLSVVW
jgi:hypothetical protein